jgi:hypothetical protein
MAIPVAEPPCHADMGILHRLHLLLAVAGGVTAAKLLALSFGAVGVSRELGIGAAIAGAALWVSSGFAITIAFCVAAAAGVVLAARKTAQAPALAGGDFSPGI